MVYVPVPIDYCLQPLDQSDCGLKPTPVFSYYKPGSRCEIEFWRGCPTLNKFDNEFICSHHCIGKLWGRTDDNNVDFLMMADVIKNADGGIAYIFIYFTNLFRISNGDPTIIQIKEKGSYI